MSLNINEVSTLYMGHVDVAATQRYLTMTPELLNEASLRFQRYATEGGKL